MVYAITEAGASSCRPSVPSVQRPTKYTHRLPLLFISVAEQEPIRSGGSGTGSGSSSRQNCAQKYKFFHKFLITIGTGAGNWNR